MQWHAVECSGNAWQAVTFRKIFFARCRLGVAEDIAELAIGHVRADLIARYNKDKAWEGRCEAFTKVSAYIAALIDAREGAAVIPLRG